MFDFLQSWVSYDTLVLLILLYSLFRFLTMPFRLWVYFLAVMSLANAVKTKVITLPAYQLGKIVLIIGYAKDFICNIVFMTGILFEIPKELTVSERVARWNSVKEDDPKYNRRRNRFTRWFRDNLLKYFDLNGGHG